MKSSVPDGQPTFTLSIDAAYKMHSCCSQMLTDGQCNGNRAELCGNDP